MIFCCYKNIWWIDVSRNWVKTILILHSSVYHTFLQWRYFTFLTSGGTPDNSTGPDRLFSRSKVNNIPTTLQTTSPLIARLFWKFDCACFGPRKKLTALMLRMGHWSSRYKIYHLLAMTLFWQRIETITSPTQGGSTTCHAIVAGLRLIIIFLLLSNFISPFTCYQGRIPHINYL